MSSCDWTNNARRCRSRSSNQSHGRLAETNVRAGIQRTGAPLCSHTTRNQDCHRGGKIAPGARPPLPYLPSMSTVPSAWAAGPVRMTIVHSSWTLTVYRRARFALSLLLVLLCSVACSCISRHASATAFPPAAISAISNLRSTGNHRSRYLFGVQAQFFREKFRQQLPTNASYCRQCIRPGDKTFP